MGYKADESTNLQIAIPLAVILFAFFILTSPHIDKMKSIATYSDFGDALWILFVKR